MEISLKTDVLNGRYYDEFATNCPGCGWLREGHYLDGRPYKYCFYLGTIMHKQSNVECKHRRTPEQVNRRMASQKTK